jgi:hypothetical protein
MKNDFLAQVIRRQFGISNVLCDHAIQEFEGDLVGSKCRTQGRSPQVD